jgi:hypothetical protein
LLLRSIAVYPIKRVVGEEVLVEADVFADGHDAISCVVLHRPPQAADGVHETAWQETPMEFVVNDRWRGAFTVNMEGTYCYTIAGWVDPSVLSDHAPVWIFGAMLLLGALVATRGFVGDVLPRVLVGSLAATLIVGSMGWMVYDGLQRRWVSDINQWANQDVRTSLAAVHEVVADAGERPNVLLVNYLDTNDPATGTNTAYGWAKTWTNVFRTGLPGDAAERSVTYLGTIDNFLAGQPTTSSAGSRTSSRAVRSKGSR